MAGDKKATIVIKKIDGGGAGAHGGGWKVAFADFMTAMMCFFLVMWLTAQSAETKAQVASYFSGPSMLEHDFTSYGAELTLEKLFLDLVNEPLKTAQNFLQPVDFTPNVMAMGSKKMAIAFVAAELGAVAKNVTVEGDMMEFEIPDRVLFEIGTSNPSAQFVGIIGKLQNVTIGLEESRVEVESTIYQETVAGAGYETAARVASQRKDLIGLKIKSGFESPTNEVLGRTNVKSVGPERAVPDGSIRITIRQKDTRGDGRKPRKLEDLFDGDRRADMDVYSDFVRRVSQEKGSQDKPSKTK